MDSRACSIHIEKEIASFYFMKMFFTKNSLGIKIVAATGAAALLLAVLFYRDAYGQVMQSQSYKIESDSVNFGGGRSGSGAYGIEDSLGEVATGLSTSTGYVMQAGYQAMQIVGLAVTPADSVVMSPSIGGVTGGVSNGSTAFTVTTDDSAGYAVTIAASSSPALAAAGDSFADYAPSGSSPDYDFTYREDSSVFAFSTYGRDSANGFRASGSVCGSGSEVSGKCWDGLATSPKTIVSRSSANQPDGTVTVLSFRAASGSNHSQAPGTYVATTTLTVLPL